jgi:hypothetical protein
MAQRLNTKSYCIDFNKIGHNTETILENIRSKDYSRNTTMIFPPISSKIVALLN